MRRPDAPYLAAPSREHGYDDADPSREAGTACRVLRSQAEPGNERGVAENDSRASVLGLA